MAVVAAQIGYGDETVAYGTVATPTIFLPQVEATFDNQIDRLESDGIRAGRYVLDALDWAPGNQNVTGKVSHRLTDRSFNLLLKHGFGIQSGAGPYTETPGSQDGKGLTIQIGVPTPNGTVLPMTHVGSKVTKGSISVKDGEIAMWDMDVISRYQAQYRATSADGVTTSASPNITSASGAFSADDVGKPISGSITAIPAGSTIYSVTSATAAVIGNALGTATVNATATTASNVFTVGVPLAAASYIASLNPITFVGCKILVAGTLLPVKDIAISWDNQIVPRQLLDGTPFTAEPQMGSGKLKEFMVGLTPEFSDLVQYKRYLDGTTFAVVATFAAGANSYVFTMNCRADGSTPNGNGLKIAEQPLQYKCVGTSDAAAFSLTNTLA